MRYELTAEKNDNGIRSIMTTYHRTRKAAEQAAWEALEFGWATWIKRI